MAEVRGLALALGILYAIKLGRVQGRLRDGYQDGAEGLANPGAARRPRTPTPSTLASSSTPSPGKAVSKPTSAAAKRQELASRRAKETKEVEEVGVTAEEMKRILEERRQELEEEVARMKREMRDRPVEASTSGPAAEEEGAEVEGGEKKFAFQDVADQAKVREEAERRRAALEEERLKREDARRRREQEMEEARERLRGVKEDLDSSRHASIPKLALDAEVRVSGGAGGVEVPRAEVSLPNLGLTYEYAGIEGETRLDFALRVAMELAGEGTSGEVAAAAAAAAESEDGGPSPFATAALLDVQAARVFDVIRGAPAEDAGASPLLLDPTLADFADLDDKLGSCADLLLSSSRTKPAFLPLSLDAMLSLDSKLERTLEGSALRFNRLAFFPVFRCLFRSALGDEAASTFLKSAARDVLKTVLSLEAEEGALEFSQLAKIFGGGAAGALGEVLAKVEREASLERKRKRFSALRKLQSRSDGSSPIPERTWALRNVAATLALESTPEAARQAREMLEESVSLKAEYLGSGSHPGLLEDILPLARLASREAGSAGGEGDAEALWGRVGAIVEEVIEVLGDANASAGAEIAVGLASALGDELGRGSELALAWRDEGVSRLDGLSEEEREAIFSRLAGSDAIQELASAFSCDIESRHRKGGAEGRARLGSAALRALECYEL